MAHYRRPLAAAATLNPAIFVVEAVAGFKADSLSLIMDSVHNPSDEMALVFLYLAFVLPHGISRHLLRSANVFNSVGLLLVSGLLLWQAVERILNPAPVVGSIAVVVGNPAGRLRGSRNKLSEEGICALLRDFREHGEKAIGKVRRTQPAAYLKILALLVPREHKVEHSNPLKELTDEELEAMIEHLKASLEAQAQSAKEIEAEAVPSCELSGGCPFGPNRER